MIGRDRLRGSARDVEEAVRIRTGMGLAFLLTVFAAATGCTGDQSIAPPDSPSAGELTGVRIDVHETPD